jgi:hypothetical protein
MCVYQGLAAIAYKQVMMHIVTQLLLCTADILIAMTAVYLTGGIESPFIFCMIVPVFTLHFLYRYKGLAMGLALNLLGCLLFYLSSGGELLPALNITGPTLAGTCFSLAVFYLIPFFGMRYYFFNKIIVKNLEDRCTSLNSINKRLLSLYEMTGKLSLYYPVHHVMNKMADLCKDIFGAGRVCIFLILRGEIEIYGNPTSQEKENIYRLIVEQQNKLKAQPLENFFYDDGTAMVPVVRGTRLDGVLSIHERSRTELKRDETLLLSMAANILSTYLENLEFVDDLSVNRGDNVSESMMANGILPGL